ncbi:TetR family transcriptional regulator [Chelativorans sp. Marseille-P2723]|uniref:TetR/AcrR family transcriptional regulator n=1 Tax=Chelativorans sp. Marseille-P2723 TaxID=2709133 RepID=UPI00156DD5D4|nr:TetR family transcriptional regulator [Chelativorans sp. Marseille-P2723]
MPPSGSTKRKILKAASELARTEGSAHLSLEAIAARAGISKGGLLYNFPTKSALLKALVQQYIDEFESALADRLQDSNLSEAVEFIRLSLDDLERAKPPPSGLLAALSEDPEMLAPVRQFNRALLDRMKQNSLNRAALLVAILAVEGLRCQKLFGTDVLSPDERELVLQQISNLAKLE